MRLRKTAVAEIAYIEKRGYPISYVEMGEEPDGHYMLPEDYAALYVQWATALHKLDPKLRLGGPIFTGVNKDIETWPDAQGRTSWTARFIDYLKAHGRLARSRVSFPSSTTRWSRAKFTWSNLYDEASAGHPHAATSGARTACPRTFPCSSPNRISPGNQRKRSSTSGARSGWPIMWARIFSAGGNAVYYFHYIPLGVHRGCNNSLGTFGLFSTDKNLKIEQPLSQFFASQLINLEWVEAAGGAHRLFPASSDIHDDAEHKLVTAYAALRPDGRWSLLVVNKDQENPHGVRIVFHDAEANRDRGFSGPVDFITFGTEQYQWHPGFEDGKADPDGPPARSRSTRLRQQFSSCQRRPSP